MYLLINCIYYFNRLGNKFGPKYKSSSVEAKQKEKQEKREKKKNLAEFLKEWNMKREDLECEDLKVKFYDEELYDSLKY